MPDPETKEGAEAWLGEHSPSMFLGAHICGHFYVDMEQLTTVMVDYLKWHRVQEKQELSELREKWTMLRESLKRWL